MSNNAESSTSQALTPVVDESSKLRQCLQSIYDSSRIAAEINDLEAKLNSLTSIRQTLIGGESITSANLDQMNGTIASLEATIGRNRELVATSEQKVIEGFLEVMQSMAATSTTNASNSNRHIQQALQNFSVSLRNELTEIVDKCENNIEQVKATKMDASERERLEEQMIAFKADMLDLQRVNHNKMTADNMEHFKGVANRVESIISRFDEQSLIDTVTAGVKKDLGTIADQLKKGYEGSLVNTIDHMKGVITKQSTNFQAKVDTLQNQVNSLQTNAASVKGRVDSVQNKVDNVQGKLDSMQNKVETVKGNVNKAMSGLGLVPAMIKDEIEKHTSPSVLQQIIKSSTEYETLLTAGQQAVQSPKLPTTSEIPYVEVIQKSITFIADKVSEIQQHSQQTRAIVDTLRTQHLPETSLTAQQFDHVSVMKHMELIQKEVTLMHSNIKMIETAVDAKVKAVHDTDGLSSSSSAAPRKRLRTEEGSAIDIPGSNSSLTSMMDQLNTRLEDLESKHQKLLDFVLQCKDTVLDDGFPSRMENALIKIEQTLVCHENFIAYLMDPVSTSKRMISIKPTTAAAAEPGALHPAMIDAINQLVRQTAEEVSAPLQKKIKLLEEKLEARQS